MTGPKRNDPYWVYLKILEDPGWIFKPWLHRDTKKKRKKKKEKPKQDYFRGLRSSNKRRLEW